MRFQYFFFVYFIQFLINSGNGNFSNEDSNDDLFESSDEVIEEETNHGHLYGQPKNVLKFGQNGTFIVDTKTLDEMFLHDEVRNRSVVVVSIIGAFRKGKSFLLDYALRYMYGNYKSIAYPNNPLNNSANWMGEPDEPLKGFSWRGGVIRDTTGVILWSDVFLHEKENKKLAIVLMDTQGLFDTNTSPTDNSRIFALGTLASSVQIFNLNDVILENQLEYLQVNLDTSPKLNKNLLIISSKQLATGFSQFAIKKNNEKNKRRRNKNIKSFQNLIFLMRDWQNKQDHDYGEVGGASYLSKVLSHRENHAEALKNVRTYIQGSFERLECFLMPHPGPIVASDRSYKGQRKDFSKEFEEYLSRFLDLILNPKKLVAKKILGITVSGSEYVEFLKAYFKAFESDDIPRVETLHGITVKKQYQILIVESFDEYKSLLKHPNFNSSTFLEDLDANGNFSITTALEVFKKKRKLGSRSDEQQFRKDLKKMMQNHFEEWKSDHVKTFEGLKKIEEENLRELKEKAELAKQKLLEMQQKYKNETERQLARQMEEERKWNETLHTYKTDSTKNITKLLQEYEAQKLASNQVNEKILKDLKQQNEEMKKGALEAQKRLEDSIKEMEAKVVAKQKEMERLIAEKREKEMVEIKKESDRMNQEIRQKIKQKENSQKAEAEQKLLETRIRLEENRIRDEAEAERKRGYERTVARLEQDKRQLQEKLLSRSG